MLPLMLELMMVSSSNNRIGTIMSIVKRGNSKNWYIHFQFDGQEFMRVELHPILTHLAA
jgi:hypothetical protein